MENRTQESGVTPMSRVTPWLRSIALVSLAACALAPLRAAAGTNVVLRLDAAQFQSAGSLTIWSDISGNIHDATAGGDPEVILDVQNGLPVVSLDGNDYFVASHSYTTATAFAVAKYDGTTFSGHDGLYGAATGFGSKEQYWSGGDGGTNWGNEAGGGFMSSKYLNGSFTHQALTDPATFNLYSGVDSTPTNFASWAIGTDRGFGGSRAWGGDIAEVIVYDTALSDFDRKGVEVYLDEKWGLGLGLRASYGGGSFNDDPTSLGLLITETRTMVLRLDASRFRSASTSLAAWPDRSGKGHDATASSAPAVVMGEQNDLPVVRLDGSDDFLTVAHSYTTGCAFAVAKYTNTTFNWFDGLYGSGTDSSGSGMYWTGWNGGSHWDNGGAGGFYNAKYLNGALSNTALTDPPAFNLYSGVDTTPNSFTSWSVGRDRSIGGRTWEGDIAELVVYREPLNTFDRKGVEVYLDEKWGLGLNLRTSYGEATFNTDIFALGLELPPGTVMVVR
ncbi:MAG: hypothetical protein HN341_16810 [Verrucomicrobia bacterium]|nr:hypothetical protein [Verrucomicrobiota bacterium]